MDELQELKDLLFKDKQIQDRYKTWIKVAEPEHLPFSAEVFYDRFFSDEAEFGQVDFNKLKSSWNIVCSPWKDNQKVLDCMVHVKGVPFCKQTRSNNKFKLVERTPEKLIVEIECMALDAPYGDYFVIRDAWIIVGTENSCLYYRLLEVFFYKRTIIKKQIVDGTIKGFKENHYLWLELAKKGGHLEKPPPPPEPEPVEVEVEEEVELEDDGLEEVPLTQQEESQQEETKSVQIVEKKKGLYQIDGYQKYLNSMFKWPQTSKKSKKPETPPQEKDIENQSENTPELLVNEVEEQQSVTINVQENISICQSVNKQSAADENDEISEVLIQNRPSRFDQNQKLNTFDQMIEESGGYGSFQIQAMIFIIVALSFCTLLLHALPYLLMYPDYVCFEKQANGSEMLLSNFECLPQNFCSNPNIRAEKMQNKNAISNWISDYDMTCVDRQVIMTYYMIMFTGLVIGGIFLAPLCDRFGRKYMFICSLIGLFVLYSLLLYSRDYHDTQYSIFFYGIILALALVSGILLVVEMLPKSKMPLAITIILISEALVTIYICAYFKYFSYGWRKIVEASAIALIGLTLFIWIFIPESLRFQYDRERFEELDSNLRKLAISNGACINGEEIQGASQHAELKRENPGMFQRERLNRSPYDVLLENPQSFINLLCLIFIWIAATFNYFLVEYYLRLIKQDLYLTMMWSAGSEIFAYVVGYCVYYHLGLIKTMFRAFLLSIVGIVTLMAYLYGIHGQELMMIGILILTSKVGISAAIQHAYFGTISIFKPRVQGTTLGLCIGFAYLLCIFAPIMSRIDPIWLPMTIFGLFSFLGAFLSQILKKFPQENEENFEDILTEIQVKEKEPLLKQKKI